MQLGYLVSRYPAISHTFILREVLELRRLGIAIDVASVNGLDRSLAELTSEERQESARTFYIKQTGALQALCAVFAAMALSPFAFFKALGFALRLAGSDVRKSAYMVFYLMEAVLVARWMRAKHLSHLHVHFATPAATVGLILTHLTDYTLSITVHGPDEFYDVPGYLLREKIEAARLLCTIGSYARSQLMKVSPITEWRKIAITPLGVDPTVFQPRPFRSNPDRFEVLCVGRLVPAKGQHVLLAAVRHLIQAKRSVLLRYIGDGPDRASLEKEVQRLGLEDSVCFEGAVNQDRIQHFYRTADVFVLASFAEGIPIVLMEAMSMEIPCITTWITGIPELIRDGIDGLLVPPADDVALATAITRLIEEPVLRERLGVAGRARVSEKYDLRRNVARLADVFRENLQPSAVNPQEQASRSADDGELLVAGKDTY